MSKKFDTMAGTVFATMCIAAGMTSSPVHAEVTPFPLPSPMSAIIGGSAMDCAGCYECLDPRYIAYTVTTDPEYDWIALSFYCPNGVFSPHEGCDVLNDCEIIEGQELALFTEQLEGAARSGDTGAISSLISKSDRAYLAPERSAIQILNCARTGVRAQIALRPETLTALLADLDAD